MNLSCGCLDQRNAFFRSLVAESLHYSKLQLGVSVLHLVLLSLASELVFLPNSEASILGCRGGFSHCGWPAFTLPCGELTETEHNKKPMGDCCFFFFFVQLTRQYVQDKSGNQWTETFLF